jgi:AraC-like DNA-binding protein
MPMAVHDHVALVYFTRGRATVDQRQRYDVREGDVLLVPAGEPHRVRRTTDCANWGIGFCAPCYAPTELAGLLDPFERARAGSSAVVHIEGARQKHLAALCSELERESRGSGAHVELAQKSLLALVLVEVSRAAASTTARELGPTLVGDALRYIERNALTSISLRDVAAAVGRSPSHVTTAVKRATGKSVGEWIIAARLSEARNRLLHGDEMIDVIAERVGYADATHFIRLFRREHGVTPAAWRLAARARPSTRD